MKIAAVVITCNRLPLLPRALKSIAKQNRKPDFIFVVSNSTDDNFETEKIICDDYNFSLTRNLRTQTYTGALNSSVEEIIKHFGISDEIYFASLDDDDEWLPDYLQEIESNNTGNYDLLIGNLLRKSSTENHLQVLPNNLSTNDFLTGNPGVCGSNTFIKLKMLLKAGSFDEAAAARLVSRLQFSNVKKNPGTQSVDARFSDDRSSYQSATGSPRSSTSSYQSATGSPRSSETNLAYPIVQPNADGEYDFDQPPRGGKTKRR